MTLDPTTTGILIVIAIAGRDLIGLAIKKFWKKAVDTDYVTVVVCEKFRAECKHGDSQEVLAAMNRMATELAVLRRITVRHVLNNSELGPDDRKNLESLLAG